MFLVAANIHLCNQKKEDFLKFIFCGLTTLLGRITNYKASIEIKLNENFHLPEVNVTSVNAYGTFHFEIGHFRLSIDQFPILKNLIPQWFLNAIEKIILKNLLISK